MSNVTKTVATVGIGIAAGMVIANYATDGAVWEAVTSVFSKTKEVTEDAVCDIADVASEVAEEI